MKISPICYYYKMHPNAAYEVIKEGYDWYLLKNGIYLPKKFIKQNLLRQEKEEEYEDFI